MPPLKGAGVLSKQSGSHSSKAVAVGHRIPPASRALTVACHLRRTSSPFPPSPEPRIPNFGFCHGSTRKFRLLVSVPLGPAPSGAESSGPRRLFVSRGNACEKTRGSPAPGAASGLRSPGARRDRCRPTGARLQIAANSLTHGSEASPWATRCRPLRGLRTSPVRLSLAYSDLSGTPAPAAEPGHVIADPFRDPITDFDVIRWKSRSPWKTGLRYPATVPGL
jgi:hypothetical protein